MKLSLKFINAFVMPLLGIIVGGIATRLGCDVFRTIMLGFATSCFGYIAEMAILIAKHDKDATDHYTQAMMRYSELTEMGQKLIHRALDDVEALIEVIETDMRKILNHKERTDSNLLFHLVKLDLEPLRVRLTEIRNDGAITLQDNQLKAHQIICAVMDEENIKEYQAIYDAREKPIALDQYDEAFADALDDMVSENKVRVNGIVVIADDVNEERINELMKELIPYYKKEGYTLSYIRNKQFERGCSAAFKDDNTIKHIIRYPDIGIYGDRYVYVGVPVQKDDIQRGRFERKAATVNKYLSLSKYCLNHATIMLKPSTADSATEARK